MGEGQLQEDTCSSDDHAALGFKQVFKTVFVNFG